jgi:hypothetical protein
MRRSAGRLVCSVLAAASVAAMLSATLACSGSGGTSSNGNLGDVGMPCTLNLCFSKWCTDQNQAHCPSEYCVGQPNKTYCTIPCDISGECPNGYSCTDNCGSQVFVYPICVNAVDYALLQSLGYCPK